MRAAARATAALALAALAACGPYTDVGQKIDVSTSAFAGDAWIAQAGTEVRVLLLGKQTPAGAPAPFAYTAMDMSVAAGLAATALQGTWTEDAQHTTLQLHETLLYTLPDERSTALLSRHGVRRKDIDVQLAVTEARSPTELDLTGDASIAARYLPLPQALAKLGRAAASDAACAFHVANLGIRSSETRLLYLGSPGMIQYGTPATFAGILAGTMLVQSNVSLATFSSTTTITYGGFIDFAGVTVDGPQITSADGSGNGQLSGTIRFSINPQDAAGRLLAPIAGSLTYGGSDAVAITSGTPSGGHYTVAIDGGGQTLVSPIEAPSPTIGQCLGLP